MNDMTIKALNDIAHRIKVSPKAETAISVVTGVAATVLACKATLEVQPIVENAKETIDQLHECKEDMDPKLYKEQMTKVYFRTGAEIGKKYFLAAACGGVSIFTNCHSTAKLSRTNATLAATVTALNEEINRLHAEKEAETGCKNGEKCETVEVEDPSVKKGVKKEDLKCIENESDVSIYARFFDELSNRWTEDPEYNLMTLRNCERWFTDRLRTRHWVSLCEVYEYLDLKLPCYIDKKTGKVKVLDRTGWKYDKNNPNKRVDLGIYKTNRANRRFVNGLEPIILIDPNVDSEPCTDEFLIDTPPFQEDRSWKIGRFH